MEVPTKVVNVPVVATSAEAGLLHGRKEIVELSVTEVFDTVPNEVDVEQTSLNPPSAPLSSPLEQVQPLGRSDVPITEQGSVAEAVTTRSPTSRTRSEMLEHFMCVMPR